MDTNSVTDVDKKSLGIVEILERLADAVDENGNLKSYNQKRNPIASDIFIIPGLPLTYSTADKRKVRGTKRMLPQDTFDFITELCSLPNVPSHVIEAFNNGDTDIDFAFYLPNVSRFRVNIFKQRSSYAAIIRIVSFEIPDIADRNKWHIDPSIIDIVKTLDSGLFLVVGPAGQGKTTTLASIINEMNKKDSPISDKFQDKHIITIEEPLEYLYSHNNCVISQREIPSDVKNYDIALRSVLRESPDIILLGEMRDRETTTAVMNASESSQLIFSTLHAHSASSAIERIVDMFPTDQHQQILYQLSMTLQCIVYQKLVRFNNKTLPIFEIIKINPAIRTLIRNGKIHQIDSYVSSDIMGKTMIDYLVELIRNNTITQQEALSVLDDEEDKDKLNIKLQ